MSPTIRKRGPGSSVGAVEAKTFYFALYRHGRHWKYKKKPEESRHTALNPAEV